MKKTFTLIGSFLMFAFSGVAQQADVQVVHNSADTSASQVDVYVGANLLLDDFAFKEASPFVQVPTSDPAIVSIAPANSNDTSDAIYKDTFNLTSGESYRLVASGLLNPGNYAQNPNGINTAFGLRVNNPAMTSANMDSVGVQTFHGATDFGEATLEERDGQTLANNASFNQFSSNVTIEASNGVLDLRDANGNRIGTYQLPGFDTLGGEAGLLMASGFADPSSNNMGESLTLNYVRPNGQVYELAPTSFAFAQIVHNAADTNLNGIDVYNGAIRLAQGLNFRQATSFTAVDVNNGLVIRDGSDTLAEFNNLNLKPADTYNIVANGVLDPSQYADNPDGRNIAFDLFVNEGARTTGYNGDDQFDFNVFHGATDAGHIDIEERLRDLKLIDNLGYGEYTNYSSIDSGTYFFDVVDSSGDLVLHTVLENSTILTPLFGSSALVFASGFMDPAANQNGASFEIMAALPNGRVDTLISLNIANVQITHNAPDPVLDSVDIYLNNQSQPVIEDFPFRASTNYVDLPANDTIEIGLAQAGSSGPGDIIRTFERRLTSLQSYNLMAVGVSDPNMYPDNPDGRNTVVNLLTIPSTRQGAGGDTALTSIVHGVPDAPTVDISFSPEFYPGFSEIQGYGYSTVSQNPAPIIAQEYSEVLFSDTASGDALLSFAGDLSPYADSGMVTYVSGFVTDTGNLPEVQMLSVFPDGSTYTWNKQSIGFEEQTAKGDFGMGVYPNPAVTETQVSYNLDERRDVSMTILNNNGQAVKQIEVGEQSQGTHDKVINVSNLKSGLYHLQLKAGEEVNNARLLVR